MMQGRADSSPYASQKSTLESWITDGVVRKGQAEGILNSGGEGGGGVD